MNSEIDKLESKKNILLRLNKIEGQVRGIGKMVEADKQCDDILTQISATRAAINKVGIILLESYFRNCVSSSLNSQENSKETVLDDLLNTLERFVKFND